MALLSKEALLGASDLVEREVELDSIGGSVKVRSLPAAYSNQAQSEATELTSVGGEQMFRVNMAKLEALQVWHGLVEPKLDSVEEAERLAEHLGPAWHKLVETITDASGIDSDARKKVDTSFRDGGSSEESGPSAELPVGSGNGGSDLPVRDGVAAGDVGE